MNEKQLGPDSSIREIFDAVRPDEGMRAVPTQIPAPEGKANLAILITGSEAEANVLMANLMAYVTDMHEISQQHETESEIVSANGEPVNDEPTIIVP